MTTPRDIIQQALKAGGIVGVGQTPLAEDANDALFQLNLMLGEWQQKRYLVYRLVDYHIVSTGLYYYTIGPGGDFDILRPAVIEAAFARFLVNGADFADDDFNVDFDTAAQQKTDTPLKIILAREDYNSIGAKRLTGVPGYLFYDSAYPLGKIYVWPIPYPTQYSIHISVKEQLAQFTNLSQDINLPLEYFSALYWNLAVRLGPNYDAPPRPDTITLAKNSLDVIRGANAQVPTLRMPDGLQLNGRYDIYSDQ